MSPFLGERVLIADADSVLLRQVYKRLLDARIPADCVSDGRNAIEQLRRQPYGVVLVDLALPNAGAQHVLEFVRDTPPAERPVVLMLGDANAAHSLDFDFVQIVLRKPCDLMELVAIVKSSVETAIAHREPPPLDERIAV